MPFYITKQNLGCLLWIASEIMIPYLLDVNMNAITILINRAVRLACQGHAICIEHTRWWREGKYSANSGRWCTDFTPGKNWTIGTTVKKKMFLTVIVSFPCWTAMEVSLTRQEPRWGPISRAFPATMVMHCCDTWFDRDTCITLQFSCHDNFVRKHDIIFYTSPKFTFFPSHDGAQHTFKVKLWICSTSYEGGKYDNTEWILTIYDVGEAYSVGGSRITIDVNRKVS
jgi:hypothetical protein